MGLNYGVGGPREKKNMFFSSSPEPVSRFQSNLVWIILRVLGPKVDHVGHVDPMVTPKQFCHNILYVDTFIYMKNIVCALQMLGRSPFLSPPNKFGQGTMKRAPYVCVSDCLCVRVSVCACVSVCMWVHANVQFATLSFVNRF